MNIMLIPRSVRACVVAATVGALCIATQWNLDDNRRVDLRIYYRAVRSFDGGHLYDYGTQGTSFLYPPFAALVLHPMTRFGETSVSRPWLIAMVACGLTALAAGIGLLRGDRRLPRATVPVVAAALLWTAPALDSFQLGQINPLIAALICVDALAITRGSRYGGIGVGLAAALKVTPLVTIAMLLIAGRRREAGRALGVFGLCGTVGLVALPRDSWRYWTSVVFDATRIGGAENPQKANLHTMAELVTPSAALQNALWIMASVALVVVAVRSVLRWRDRDVIDLVIISMGLTYLISPLTWIHHYWLALVAMIAWVLRARTPPQVAVAALGLVAFIDPLTLGRTSMTRTVMMVAFCIATVAWLPRPPVSAPSSRPESDASPESVEPHSPRVRAL